MSDINDNSRVDGYYSHVAFPSTVFESLERTSNDQNEYSCFRLPNRYIDTMVDYGSEPSYETIHVSDKSSNFEHVVGLTNRPRENAIEPTTLVAQVSYDDGDDTTCWIIDSGSTYRMIIFTDEFLNLTLLEGYDDVLLVKGLVSCTKAYGIGSCIVVVKDSVGLFHPICLEDVLYVPNLLHHLPRFCFVISACSQDECQCYFQFNSYVLNIKLAKMDLHLSKGLLWITTINPSTVPHFVSVMFKIRDAYSSTMFLVHKGSDNTISIPGGYVCCNENHIECGLRLVNSLLGLRLERQNLLVLRHRSTIILDYANPIHHHTYQ